MGVGTPGATAAPVLRDLGTVRGARRPATAVGASDPSYSLPAIVGALVVADDLRWVVGSPPAPPLDELGLVAAVNDEGAAWSRPERTTRWTTPSLRTSPPRPADRIPGLPAEPPVEDAVDDSVDDAGDDAADDAGELDAAAAESRM
jgi:hypothetical protein